MEPRARVDTVDFDASPPELPVVAIIGRPNVGKSTFFNRLVGSRRALTHNRHGVTRDRHYAEAEYLDHWFVLIDIGGFEPDAASSDVFSRVRDQAMLAIEEADVVLALFDARTGIMPGDFQIVSMLRAAGKPVLFAVNKVDSEVQEAEAMDFYRLGAGELFFISAEHARGVDPLLDALVARLPVHVSWRDLEPADMSIEDDRYGPAPGSWRDGVGPGEPRAGAEGDAPRTGEGRAPGQGAAVVTRHVRIALVGRPNVGKSSLTNRLIGKERQVIHPDAGTTRDSVEIPWRFQGRRYTLIDTAGVRRKARISDKLEQFTVIKAFKALSRSDVVLLLIDAREGVTAQEQRLAGMIQDKGRGVVVVVNKWDLMPKGSDKDAYRETLIDQLDHIRFAPVLFVSAKTGAGVARIPRLVDDVAREVFRRLTTPEFNTFLEAAVAAHAPPIFRNRAVKIYYGNQVRVRPPTFLLQVNFPAGIRVDYRRYLVNRLREQFGFTGTPVHLVVRARRK